MKSVPVVKLNRGISEIEKIYIYTLHVTGDVDNFGNDDKS